MGRDGEKYADNGGFNPSGSNPRWSLAQNQRLPDATTNRPASAPTLFRRVLQDRRLIA
jgi:hypothetical protein